MGAARGSIPTIILAGRDRQPRVLPEGASVRPLVGYKAVDLTVGGRPLLAVLVERLSTLELQPLYVAGPRRLIERTGLPVSVLDLDGTFGHNIRRSVETVLRDHREGPMAIITCDVLPEAGELRRLLDAYTAERPIAFWFPVVRVPDDRSMLGASAWKPTYRIPEAPGVPPVELLPGHLALFEPALLRRSFMYRLMDLGYRTRNQPIPARRPYIVRRLLPMLLREDLRDLLSGLAPRFTYAALTEGVGAARKLHQGLLTLADLERVVARIFLTERARSLPEGRVRIPITDALGMAKDIDTVEEAMAAGAEDAAPGVGDPASASAQRTAD